MTWTAPQARRIEPSEVAGERAALDSFLDYHRQTLLWKCSGLTAEQLKRPAVASSTLTLLGLVRHLTEVERSWFRRRVAGQQLDAVYLTEADPDADFTEVDAADPEADFAAYQAEIELVRAALVGRGLDETFVHPRTGTVTSLRWVYLHMLEEYARHNGHADLIREAVDGATGE